MKKDKNINANLTDEEFLKIAKEAHKNDITFNHMIERILTRELLLTTEDLLLILDYVNESDIKNETKQHTSRRPTNSKPSSTCGTSKKIKR